jgi:lipopolysaccharide assembly protein A
MKQLIIAFVIALLAVIFALQNAVPVKVTLFLWEFNLSLALLIVLLLFMGILAGLLVASRIIWNKNTQIKTLERSIKNDTAVKK